MRAFRQVLLLELRILYRGRDPVLALPVAILVGIVTASLIREAPWGAWSQFTFASTLLSLVLTLGAGGGIRRDGEYGFSGVLLSTPIPTIAYVGGKYMAQVTIHGALVCASLAAAIVTDHVYSWQAPPFLLGRAVFPPLGPQPYIVGWTLLMPVPLLFGAALALACCSFGGGGRPLLALVALLFWLGPLATAGWPPALDLTGLATHNRAPTEERIVARLAVEQVGPVWEGTATLTVLPPSMREAIARQAASIIPPRNAVGPVWGRLLFAACTGLLLGLTVDGVARQRHGS